LTIKSLPQFNRNLKGTKGEKSSGAFLFLSPSDRGAPPAPANEKGSPGLAGPRAAEILSHLREAEKLAYCDFWALERSKAGNFPLNAMGMAICYIGQAIEEIEELENGN